MQVSKFLNRNLAPVEDSSLFISYVMTVTGHLEEF